MSFTAVNVMRAPGVTQQQLRDRIVAELGSQYRVKTGQELAAESGQQLDEGLQFFNYILLGFAFVALFVGVFLILNTFSIIVAQRMRELALMRAVGASRVQIVASVEAEAAVVGVLSSVVGFGLGVGVGRLLAWMYATFLGGGVALAPFAVPPSAVYGSFAVGILVTMVAALLPAMRAARIPPVAAMREAATADRPLTRITVAGAAVTLAGGALLWAGLTDHAGNGNSLVALLIGLLLVLTGAAMLTPSLARPVVPVLGAVFARWTPGRLGGRNSARNPRRTAVTASALMVGIALITGISVVLTSVTVSMNHILDKQMHADLIIAGEQSGAVAADLRRRGARPGPRPARGGRGRRSVRGHRADQRRPDNDRGDHRQHRHARDVRHDGQRGHPRRAGGRPACCRREDGAIAGCARGRHRTRPAHQGRGEHVHDHRRIQPDARA